MRRVQPAKRCGRGGRQNPLADQVVVQDLNVDPQLPFDDASHDAVVCCMSIDYLMHPVEVLREAAQVLRRGGVVVPTFSNRCFPTKAVRGWLATDEDGRVTIVRTYLERAGFEGVTTALRSERRWGRNPLYDAWALLEVTPAKWPSCRSASR